MDFREAGSAGGDFRSPFLIAGGLLLTHFFLMGEPLFILGHAEPGMDAEKS
jgi:hypothetical protein